MTTLRSAAGLIRWVPIVAMLLSGVAPAAEPESLRERLKAAGIESTRQGIEKVLDPMRLTPERSARIRALLADLGNDEFDIREKATAELAAMPNLPQNLLKEAAEKELEVKLRIERILSDPARSKVEGKLLLALDAVKEDRVKGLAPLLVELFPLWREGPQQQAALAALVASAERTDEKLLRDSLARSKPRELRLAALAALTSVFGKDAAKDLEDLLGDTDAQVCLAASVQLLNQENRKPLAALVRLLEADEPAVRQAAATLLRDVSGKKIDFAGFDTPEQRAKGVAAWRAWVKEDGDSAKLNLPVAMRKVYRGRIVVAHHDAQCIREIDAITGETIFESGGFTYPWGAHGTADGHRLMVDYVKRQVVEFDANAKECWRKDLPGQPTSVQRLDNGRTLLALPEPNAKVVEIDRDGKVVWEAEVQGRPSCAQRLDNGNTLVALQNAAKVVTIDRFGKVVSQIEGMGAPHTAEQLDNGNVLVCDFQKGIQEYDRTGKVVWSLPNVNNPSQAQRLPNGNTLVAGNDGLVEYDHAGKVVRQFKVGRCRFFAY